MPVFEFPYRSVLEIGGAMQNNPTTSLSADGNNIAVVFQAEFTMSVKKAWHRQITAGSTSAGSSLTVSIETINASDGLPSGTTIVSQSFTNPVTFPVTFTTAGTINKGTFYALKIQQTGTPGVQAAVFTAGVTNSNLETFVPYTVINGVRGTVRIAENWYLEGESGSPNVMGFPLQLSTTQNLNNALQAGMKFRIPTTVCSTYKLLGIKLSTDTNNTGTVPDIRVSLYDWNSGNNSTALETTDYPAFAVTNIANVGVNEYWFDNPPTLTAGSDYIVAVGTSDTGSATNVCTARHMTILDTVKPALWDQTNNYIYDRVSRTSYTGSWTTTADSMYTMSLILDVASLPSGGGGGYSANFNQGFGG